MICKINLSAQKITHPENVQSSATSLERHVDFTTEHFLF